jgi:UDP-galactopyranose mutase
MLKQIKIDFLIVGAGFYGSVLAERISTILKKKVIILEKRNHIGGNCYSEIDKDTKIEYHKYGTHIFHTSSETVWDYITKFTKFNSYRHQVLSRFNKKTYQLPINLETINAFYNKNFNPHEAKKFLEQKTKKFQKKSYLNFEEKAFSQIGPELYSAFIKEYTEKQWNKDPKLLPSNIFNRLPLRFNYREDYFNNCKYQGIPLDGYTAIFNKLLLNKRIEVKLNNEFKINNKYDVKYETIYTGPLDSLFNFKLGMLEWRSLAFKKEIICKEDYQGTSVINFPEKKFKYTRIHEPKHLHIERNYNNEKTLIIKEYPIVNEKEPYYPINTAENRKKHRDYKFMCKKIKNFSIGGRLADYAYYDMDMTISAALVKFNQIKKKIY